MGAKIPQVSFCPPPKKKPPGQLATVRTPENRGWVCRAFSTSPQYSGKKHAQSLGILRTLFHTIVKDIAFHPCKILIMQELKPDDHEMCLQFALTICEN